MSGTPFTDYLRTADPDAERRARRVLSARLRRELGARGLRDLSPRLLGFAAARWDAAGWEELVQAVFVFALEERRESLRAQLKIKDNVEGLVIRNVRHFLHERQRAADPVGYRTYELVRGAVEDLVDAGRLTLEPGPRVSRADELSLPETPEERAAAWPPEAEDRVRGWAEELVAPLLTGRKRARLRQELAARILELSADVTPRWLFQELLDALKSEMRKRWDALHRPDGELGFEGEDGDEESGTRPVPMVRPTEVFSHRQAYTALEDCIEDGVRRSEPDSGGREHLADLWQYLRALAPSGEPRPSKRRLSRILEIPRGQVDRWLPVLESIYRRCEEAVSGRAAYPDFGPA